MPRKKQQTPRTRKNHDIAFMGEEPTWEDYDNLTPEQISTKKTLAFSWYEYFDKGKENLESLYEWMKLVGYAKDQIRLVKQYPDNKKNSAITSSARMQMQGLPYKESEWLRNKLSDIITEQMAAEKAKKEEAKKAKNENVKKLSVQEKLRIQFGYYVAEIDEWEDNVFTDKTYEYPNMLEWLRKNEIAQSYINKLIEYYEPKYNEIQELLSPTPDKELAEAFSYLKKADIKRISKFYEDMFGGLNAFRTFKRNNRKPRKRKAITAAKLVEKLNYKKEDTDLNLVSIDPASIVGASTVWLFNTKTRKLGVLKAADDTKKLNVKGSTVIGFDPETSISKTIRKPNEVLPDFMKEGKIKLRTYLDDIRAVEVKMKGRINKDTLILRVY